MTLYTTGYQGETINLFVNKLLQEKIEAIVDIRKNPFSRKAGFSKKPLNQKLVNAGIDYYHFEELGTPEPLRNYLTAEGNYKVFFENYRNYLAEFKDSLDDLIDIGTKKRICIMCFEKDPHFCHRKVVAELLQEYSGKKVDVIHL